METIKKDLTFFDAIHSILCGKNVLVLGEAGTGKSTFIHTIKKLFSDRNVVVLAPTGLAALNVQGQTIHSFFGFPTMLTPNKVKELAKNFKKGDNFYKHLDMIIIDEISMVRADLVDYMNDFLQIVRGSKKPFGGIQMIWVGDLFQLPPVVTQRDAIIFQHFYSKGPFFFDSKVFSFHDFEVFEFKQVYRQQDPVFRRILGRIRLGEVTHEDLKVINSRVNYNFEPTDYIVYLTTTRKKAESINLAMLNKMPGEEHTYLAEITGNLKPNDLPSPIELTIKRGTQVMFTANNLKNGWTNGQIGIVIDFDDDKIRVKLESGEVEVTRQTWQFYKYTYDPKRKTITTEIIGTFKQFPLRPAWAITIHKAQGLTFSQACIDLDYVFAPGQAYVALSRVKSLDGLILKRPIRQGHIFTDQRIIDFYKKRLPLKKDPG